MTRRHYQPHEDAVLAQYVAQPVMCWNDVLSRLPGRSMCSGSKRLLRLRKKAGTVWKIPQGTHLKPWQFGRRA